MFLKFEFRLDTLFVLQNLFENSYCGLRIEVATDLRSWL